MFDFNPRVHFFVVVRAFACEAGRLGLILSWIIPKTLKMVSVLLLLERSAFKSCAEDKETASGLYVSERKINSSRGAIRP